MTTEAMIAVDDLRVRFGTELSGVYGVRGVNLSVAEGSFFTLLGPSGCGKTTTLRCIAGLETPTKGDISIGSDAVFSSSRGVSTPTYRRDIGMVFQSYAIWPHMSVFENVAFPLREMKPRVSRSEIRDRVTRALELVQLQKFIDRPAPNLSGGQQQRLALARAIVREPKVLLLDEPLSNLDAKLRESMRTDLRDLVEQLGITTVYVTHDQVEALTMSDRVAVMKDGEIVQEGAPADIYRRPTSRFVGSFIGIATFIEGRLAADARKEETIELMVANMPIRCIAGEDLRKDDRISVLLRPEDVRLHATRPDMETNVVPAVVKSRVFAGDTLEIKVDLAGQVLDLRVHPETAVEAGDHVFCEIPRERCRAFAE